MARVAADQAAETRCSLQLRAHVSHMTISSECSTSHVAHLVLLLRLWWSIGAGGRQLQRFHSNARGGMMLSQEAEAQKFADWR